MFIYFERERGETASVGEGQREETQNLKQPPGSEKAVSPEPDMGLEPRNHEIMT